MNRLSQVFQVGEFQQEKEKKKDYRNTVAIQIVVLSFALVADDGLRLLGSESRGFLFDGSFHLLGGIYLLALCDMIRNYTSSRWVIRGSYGLIASAFSLMVAVHLLFNFSQTGRQVLLLIAYTLLALVQFEVIGFAIRDLFRSRHHAADRLWGSACIYFMSGFAFASVLAAVLLLNPQAFGPQFDSNSYIFFETIYLSFNALVGLDTSYPQAIRLVRNLSLIEGLWSQLYLVLLIGRLLTPSTNSD